MTSVCVYGLGAMGGLLAARLALSGVRVTAIARGLQLEVVKAKGLTLIGREGRETVQLRAVGSPQEAGAHDLVFLAVKFADLPGAAAQFRPLLTPGATLISIGSGFPWWYFFRAGGAGNPTLANADPRGSLWRLIGPEHAVGCVAYPAARIVEPGVIEHLSGNRLVLGEPDGSMSPRLQRIGALLTGAGFDAPLRQDIRTELWTRLALDAGCHPVSLLTGATYGQMLDDAGTAATLEVAINEAIEVAASLGISMPLQARQLMELTREQAGQKTSVLRDLESRRTVELGPVAGAVGELSRLRGMQTPVLDALLSLAVLRVRLYGAHGG